MTFTDVLSGIMVLVSVVLCFQSLITLTWMLYAWEDSKAAKRRKSLTKFLTPTYSFTALIPARHEENVIAQTISAVAKINYPVGLTEIIVLIRADDLATIRKALEAKQVLLEHNIQIKVFDDFPINKPHSLNHGLSVAQNQIIAVFDAEDEPHPDIYNVINTLLVRHESVGVVQSGVQLMNYKSHWFSALNCVEYFFWFKSGLHFFANIGRATPLGGNTVFFKKEYLQAVDGWDEKCLTEDADIGVRLAATNVRQLIVYDEAHVTQEETPKSTSEFLKQRTRWHQGFIQILAKGDWVRLPEFRQRAIIAYTLLSPLLQAVLVAYFPFAVLVLLKVKLPILVSMFSFFPVLLFLIQFTITLVGIYEFTKAYEFRFPFLTLVKAIFLFLPYQILLMVASFRALYRHAWGITGWEKTSHVNAHRSVVEAGYET